MELKSMNSLSYENYAPKRMKPHKETSQQPHKTQENPGGKSHTQNVQHKA
jgi:hypothetical protein